MGSGIPNWRVVKILVSQSRFTLTPALSLRERGKGKSAHVPSPLSRERVRERGIRPLSHGERARVRGDLSPLPRGEGQGEGDPSPLPWGEGQGEGELW